MKKFLLLFSVLSLLAVGCNRDEAAPERRGMMEEEQTPTDTYDLPAEEGVQEMEDVEMDRDMESMEESEPVMQEEETLYDDPEMIDERDSSMGSGTDTAPEAEPTDATGIQQ